MASDPEKELFEADSEEPSSLDQYWETNYHTASDLEKAVWSSEPLSLKHRALLTLCYGNCDKCSVTRDYLDKWLQPDTSAKHLYYHQLHCPKAKIRFLDKTKPSHSVHDPNKKKKVISS